ncbi:hypothetical protein GGI17_003035 [Coemansia sp. S146]|nr:hypothetical protein GGI17_003035 [Coemansia sp. S146]
MFVSEYLQFLESVNVANISRGIWTMVTARNALAISTVCAFVIASLTLWNQPRRAMLLKRTVGHVLEAGFGTGDGNSGKPLLPRFIRRLFHSQLPQFDTRRDSGLALEKVDSEAAYQHNGRHDVCASPGSAPDTPPPPLLPPLLPLIFSGSELSTGASDSASMQHVGGGAKRRHRRHGGRKDIRAAATVSAARPMAKQLQRIMYRAMLVASRRHRPTVSNEPLPSPPALMAIPAEAEFATVGQAIDGAETESATTDQADEVQATDPLAAAGPTRAPMADDDPVVDVTQPRRYRPAPIGQRSAGDTPPLPFYALAPSTAAPLLGSVRASPMPLDFDWPPQIGTDPEFSLFSRDFFS